MVKIGLVDDQHERLIMELAIRKIKAAVIELEAAERETTVIELEAAER